VNLPKLTTSLFLSAAVLVLAIPVDAEAGPAPGEAFGPCKAGECSDGSWCEAVDIHVDTFTILLLGDVCMPGCKNDFTCLGLDPPIGNVQCWDGHGFPQSSCVMECYADDQCPGGAVCKLKGESGFCFYPEP
jgi:hypothetical protein